MVPTCFESSWPVNICVDTERQDYLGLEVFDYLVGYWQYANDYQLTPTVIFGAPQPNSYNILFLHMPNTVPDNLDQYDLVLLDNGDEPFGRGTAAMYQILDTVAHSRLLCNSILSTSHPMAPRVINSSIMWGTHRRYYTDPKFPQQYELNSGTEKHSIVFINGRNSTSRRYWTEVLQHYAPEIPHHNDLHCGITNETLQCWHESLEDSEFRQAVNQKYTTGAVNNTPPEQRWPPLPAGVGGRYGATLFEDQFIPAFREHKTIIYPETPWQNYQLSLNEKALKCFLHQKFAMPVSGAGTHQLYADIGFKTAWHLSPPEHRGFDSIDNHFDRYQQQAQACEWLWQHPEVFQTAMAKQLLVDNQAQCMLTSSQAGLELYNIINENS